MLFSRSTLLVNCHRCLSPELFQQNWNSYLWTSNCPLSDRWQPSLCFLSLRFWLFKPCTEVESYSSCLSLTGLFQWACYPPDCRVCENFPCNTARHSIVRTCHLLLVDSFAGRQGRSHVLGAEKRVTGNAGVQLSLWGPALRSVCCIPRQGLRGHM